MTSCSVPSLKLMIQRFLTHKFSSIFVNNDNCEVSHTVEVGDLEISDTDENSDISNADNISTSTIKNEKSREYENNYVKLPWEEEKKLNLSLRNML